MNLPDAFQFCISGDSKENIYTAKKDVNTYFITWEDNKFTVYDRITVFRFIEKGVWIVLKDEVANNNVKGSNDLNKPLSDVDLKIKELEESIKTYNDELNVIDTKKKGLTSSLNDCHYSLSILRSARDIIYPNSIKEETDTQEEKEVVYVIYKKDCGYSAGGEYQPDLNCPVVTVYDSGLEASLDKENGEEIIPVYKDKNGWLTLK